MYDDILLAFFVSMSLAILRVLLVHLLVPKCLLARTEELTALVQCKLTHLLSAESYHFSGVGGEGGGGSGSRGGGGGMLLRKGRGEEVVVADDDDDHDEDSDNNRRDDDDNGDEGYVPMAPNMDSDDDDDNENGVDENENGDNDIKRRRRFDGTEWAYPSILWTI